jgi:Protein of unknown function (DUF4058)
MGEYVVFILLAAPAVLLPLMIWYFVRQVDSQKSVRGFDVKRDRTPGQRVSSDALGVNAAMPSPFPGMDPYLESPTYWSDFHSTYIHALREAMNDRLPRNYTARIEEEVVIVEPEGRDKEVRPDVAGRR